MEKVILIILDGWGLSDDKEGNAIALAQTPNFDRYWAHYPHCKLNAHGKYAGLPDNQDGNSEAGHINLGGGRIILQDAVYISKSIKDGTFFKNPAFKDALIHTKKNGSNLHLMGLLSGQDSPHSYPDHVYALFELCQREKVRPILHLFTDGRDSSQHGAIKFYRDLKKNFKNGEVVSTICGRYYAMDRKKKWENIEKVYNLLTLGQGTKVESVEEAISHAYDQGLTDEFINPSIVVKDGKTMPTIDSNDSVIFFNLRSDRARELTKVFGQKDFTQMNPESFERKKSLKNIKFVEMTDFGPDLPNVLTAFPSRDIINSLPFIIDGMPQLYIAEAEKYAHVTFFFNGGWAKSVAGEERIRVPSPDVSNYDQIPEMNASEVTKILKEKIKGKKHNFICVNYANPDMIGHTGNLEAGVKCCEVLDKLVGQVVNYSLENDYTVILTADHGNIEQMIDLKTGEVDTKHSINPVPFILINKNKNIKLNNGVLGDVAPTILELMKIKKPKEMRTSLISKK
jgi:2,3-bisphosphoglycerate-independent phosphoglycerate mutase